MKKTKILKKKILKCFCKKKIIGVKISMDQTDDGSEELNKLMMLPMVMWLKVPRSSHQNKIRRG